GSSLGLWAARGAERLESPLDQVRPRAPVTRSSDRPPLEAEQVCTHHAVDREQARVRTDEDTLGDAVVDDRGERVVDLALELLEVSLRVDGELRVLPVHQQHLLPVSVDVVAIGTERVRKCSGRICLATLSDTVDDQVAEDLVADE